MKNIYIGTSGWSYKHWKSIYYPENVRPRGYLSFLSAEFNATEINASFYRLPQSETILQWIRSVPAEFRFCPKMSRYLTQMKKLNDPEEPLERFFTLFKPMKKHLGPTLIQLPPNLGFHPGKTEYLFNILKEKYGPFKIALEPRHESWLEVPAINLLNKFQITWVIADSGGRFPMAEAVTAKDIYIRFHGPDGSYATSYTQEALEAYAEKCIRWSAKGHRLWLFFNNDIHGYAIENARNIKKILQIE